MKKLMIAILTILTVNSFAHTTQDLNVATNSVVEASRSLGESVASELDKRYDHIGGGTVFRAYKITKLSPGRKANESDADFAVRVVKSLLHRDYPITGDDGGYDFTKLAPKSEAEMKVYFDRNLEWLENSSDTAPKALPEFIKSLASVTKQVGVVVLDGNGSGNNTMASILAVVDLNRNELFYIMDSNFGSDD
jgi:hypothetical protein